MVNLVNLPVSSKEMEMYKNKHLKQIEHTMKQWEARENKVKNNALRKEWVERQNNNNYRVEHDRIRSDLSHYRLPYASKERLQNRQAQMYKLFSSGII
jgi:hypothetical protein